MFLGFLNEVAVVEDEYESSSIAYKGRAPKASLSANIK